MFHFNGYKLEQLYFKLLDPDAFGALDNLEIRIYLDDVIGGFRYLRLYEIQD